MRKKIKQAIELLNQNELIITPTDTVYGLLCNPHSKKALNKIYSIKKRNKSKPLILLGANFKSLLPYVNLKAISKKYLNQFSKLWPGPVTLILPCSKSIPKHLNPGFKTIGIRIPNNIFLLELLHNINGNVLASTSANISGESDRYPQKEILKKVKFFQNAKKNEMTYKPSTIILITQKGYTTLR